MTGESGRGTALVTGCSSGIGRTIATMLLAGGWHVIGISRTRPDIAEEGFRHVAADLLDPASTEAALGRVERVDALIHAAGLLRVGTHDAMSLEEGARMWRLHVDAAAQLVQRLAPGMPDGGRIVLVGSRVAAGAAGRSLYAASKSALIGFARSLAAELAPRRITVNVIAPGATDTPMLRDPERAASAPKMPPIGRYVRPEEVAGLATFLLSDAAASLTGQQIVICGGASL
jgi:NAD(P)-dependent dehydrogenase (short-subunit alcohol dehydrogenase family)